MKKIIVVGICLFVILTARSQSIRFSADINNDKINLNWSIDTNEASDKFELERSVDGTNFKMAALVFTSEKKGNEDYKFFERLKTADKVYYRIKRYYHNETIIYSQVVCLSMKETGKNKMDL
jgi:hypothetical protein